APAGARCPRSRRRGGRRGPTGLAEGVLNVDEAFSLSGRVAIVTGAGGGLGEGICLRLAAAGAAGACVGRTKESLDASRERVGGAGGRAVSVLCDVADQASVEAMVADVARQLGGIDVLVNNAAIYPRRAWTEIAKEEWDRVLGTNLTGYFLCARAAFPYL